MALILPRLTGAEFLASSTWNTAMAAIETEFTLPATLAWPLLAEGSIDMQGNSLLGVAQFWNIYNAAEYDSWQDVLDEVDIDGKGAIAIPPNTTIEANGTTLNADDVLIEGYGSSSVLKLVAGAGANLMASTADSRIVLRNLTIDCNSVAAKDGLVFDGATEVILDKVWIKNVASGQHGLVFTGSTNTNIIITNCPEIDGLLLDDCHGLVTSNSTLTGPLDITHATTGDLAKRLAFDNVYFNDVVATISNAFGATDDNLNWVSFDRCTGRSSVFAITKARRATLADLRMFADGDTGVAVTLTDCEYADMSGVKVHDYTGDSGIIVSGGTYVTADNVLAANCGNLAGTKAAIDFNGMDFLMATNVRSINSLERGICVRGDFTDVELDSLYIRGAAGRGIEIDYSTPTTCNVFVNDPRIFDCGGHAAVRIGSASDTKLFTCQGGQVAGNSGGAGNYLFDSGVSIYGTGNIYRGPFQGSSVAGLTVAHPLAALATWNSGSIGAGASGNTTVTVDGASPGPAQIIVSHNDANNVYFAYGADITANNTVTVYAHNLDTVAHSLAGSLYVLVIPGV